MKIISLFVVACTAFLLLVYFYPGKFDNNIEVTPGGDYKIDGETIENVRQFTNETLEPHNYIDCEETTIELVCIEPTKIENFIEIQQLDKIPVEYDIFSYRIKMLITLDEYKAELIEIKDIPNDTVIFDKIRYKINRLFLRFDDDGLSIGMEEF